MHVKPTLKPILFCCLLLGIGVSLFAQNNPILDQPRAKKPHAVVMSGICLNYNTSLNHGLPSSFFAAEYAVTRFFFAGLQYDHLIISEDPTYKSDNLYDFPDNRYNTKYAYFKRGFEVGINCKYFFHARFSDRHSRYFIGLDVRKGAFHLITTDLYTDSPVIPFYKSVEIPVTHQTFKMMINLGLRYTAKAFVFEFSCPFGLETETPGTRNSAGYYLLHTYAPHPINKFVLIPGIKFGFII